MMMVLGQEQRPLVEILPEYRPLVEILPEEPAEKEPVWTTFVIEEGVTYEPVAYPPPERVVTIPTAPEPVFRQVHMVHYDEPPEPAPEVEAEPEIEAEAAGIAIDTKTLFWIGGGAALLWALTALGKTRRAL